MKKYLFLMLINIGYSTIINIPADHATIQAGIDASVNGDTVLVANGIYYENLSIDKDITLASHFIIDGNIDHRDSTIIDGSAYDEDLGPFGSCVLFLPPENGDHIHPKLTGFTIQNGRGTRMREQIETPEGDITIISFMGGGLTIWYSFPEVTYNYIKENGTGSNSRSRPTRRGGGATLVFDDNDVEFDEDRNLSMRRTIHHRDDEIIFSNNIFENNNSEIVSTLESIGFTGDIDLSNSYFDIFSYEYEDISEYWMKYGDANTNFLGVNGIVDAITYDVWVSTDGQDGISIMGTEEDPFQTIDYALSRLYIPENDTSVIHILEGTYAPSTTGEVFPIRMISNITLKGEGQETTIIDAEQTGTVLSMDGTVNNKISDLTIKGGFTIEPDYFVGGVNGGGIYINRADAIIEYVTITENSGRWFGGVSVNGGYNYSVDPITLLPFVTKLDHVTITDNTNPNTFPAYTGGLGAKNYGKLIISNSIINENITYSGQIGGGIGCIDSNLEITNTLINGNITNSEGSEPQGGGIFSFGCTSTLTNVTISNNSIGQNGIGGAIYMMSGGVHGFTDTMLVVNSIIWDNIDGWEYGDIFIRNIGYEVSTVFSVGHSNIEGDSSIIFTQGFSDGDFEVNFLEGNIDTVPHFTDPENGDFTLSYGSPCIDAGIADTDGDGEDDITDYNGTAPDMGAFESLLPVVTGLTFSTFDTYIALTWNATNHEGFQYYLLERSTDAEFTEENTVSNYVSVNYYEDNDMEYDTEYFYRVSYYAGTWSEFSEVISLTLEWMDVDDSPLPSEYAIHQNYPNPFNPLTILKYDLPEKVMVKVDIYNILGMQVTELVNDEQDAGYHSVQWNATNNQGEPVSAGVYLYKIQAGDFVDTKKMILLK